MKQPYLGFLVLGLLAGCESTSEFAYKLYPGQELPDTELVTLSFGDNGINEVLINGIMVQRSEYGTVKLLPGECTVLIPRVDIEVSAEFEKGHHYLLQWGLTKDSYGQPTHRWIEDTGLGTFVGTVTQR